MPFAFNRSVSAFLDVLQLRYLKNSLLASYVSIAIESKKHLLMAILRRAINKVKFLLSFSATRWVLSSISGSRVPRPGRVSFRAQPSLLDGDDAGTIDGLLSRTESLSPTNSSASTTEIGRTSSGASTESSAGADDIDKRAEQFIENFYKHIQMERQVSLQLRYRRGNSLESG